MLLACALLGLGFSACARPAETRAVVSHAEGPPPPPGAYLDDEFAATVRDLLVSEPGTRERAARLGAIELRQMARAEARFAARSVEGGMAALTGALTLVHTAEATPALFGPRSVAALADGARAFAQRGDEGRSRALYNVLLPMATSAERADIEHHLTAIDSWVKALRSDGGPTAAAGVVERIEVRRRMLEPSQAAMDSAVRATTAWVKEALALRELFRKTRAAPSHDDGVEAWRAIETGPVVLVSLYLRDGDIVGALSAARREPFLSLLESGRSQFSMTLAAAGRDATSAACITLLRHFRSLTGGDANDDNDAFADDRDLFAMATFGIAGECYRRDPSAPAAALTLGRALEELGMAEAAPAVLVPSVQAHPDPHFVGESLDISLHALLGEQELGDVDGARRTFRAAQPLLAVASQPALRGKVRPSSARLRAAMGNIELREGRPDLAQDLLTRSADEEKSADVLLSLANIEARGHRARAALEHIAGALGLADSMRDSALRSEILLAKSDVLREEGQEAPARDALAEALRTLAEARTRLSGSALARVERVLACVLDRFGASGPAERAVERAYAAAPAEKTQVSRTVGALLGRALVRGDLPAAREWLRLAVGVDAEDGDLVHYALWTRILERQRHVVSDGAPDRVFAAVPDDRRWASLLARYGEGKLNLDELLARAATPEHKSEGFFYEAMERRANGDASGEKDLLRHLLARAGLSETLELVVRGLLDRGVSWADAPLPPDVAIP